MRISIFSFITIGILFISANPATVKTEPVTYYVTENGIKGVAAIHQTSLQDLRKAFPDGKYVDPNELKDPNDPNDFVFSRFSFKSMSGTFYMYNDTVWAIMLQQPLKAVVLNDVRLGSTTLAQFRALHPELTITRNDHTLGKDFSSCEIGNITLFFIDFAAKQYDEKSMIFNAVQIGSTRRPY